MNAPIKVMVVEDESIVAFNLQQRLSQLGYDASAVGIGHGRVAACG
jgi:hypothetical protein